MAENKARPGDVVIGSVHVESLRRYLDEHERLSAEQRAVFDRADLATHEQRMAELQRLDDAAREQLLGLAGYLGDLLDRGALR